MDLQATAIIEDAVETLFDQLDAERWEALVDSLHPDVELADELTGEWLRGRERVAGYLQAQRGILVAIRSRLRLVQARWLSPDLGLATFVCEQRYRLGDVEHHESLTGATILEFAGDGTRLLLFHLGAASQAFATSEPPEAPAAGAPAPPGERFRLRRRALGISLRALGERTGLSASFLSQIERGVAEPSVGSLVRIAQALEIPMSEVLGEQPALRLADRTVRDGARRRVDVPASTVALELLSDAAARDLEVTVFTLPPGATGVEPAAVGRGERLLHVLEGRVGVSSGADGVTLGPGDSLTLGPGAEYSLTAEPGEPLRCLSVFARPRADREGPSGGGGP
jgi:transcriptional regulator with XRE-family HTH domain